MPTATLILILLKATGSDFKQIFHNVNVASHATVHVVKKVVKKCSKL